MLLIIVKGGGIFLLWCNGGFDLCYFLVDKQKEVGGKQQKWLWDWRDWRKRKIKAMYLCSFYKMSGKAGLLWASEGYKCQGMEGVEERNWVSTLQVLVQAGSLTHSLIQKENFHRPLWVSQGRAAEEQKPFVWQQGRCLLWYFSQGAPLKSAVVGTSDWLASVNVITSHKNCFPFVLAFPDRRSFRKLLSQTWIVSAWISTLPYNWLPWWHSLISLISCGIWNFHQEGKAGWQLPQGTGW